MPFEHESKFAQLVAAFREWVPTVRVRFNEWFEVCREEPIMIWHTPAIRYTTYGVAALLVYSILSWSTGLLAPRNSQATDPARTTDFRVICTSPDCGHEFTINRRFKFDDFPVKCPKCKQETGQRAYRCYSDVCGKAWVVPELKGSVYVCPNCGRPIATR